MQMCNLDLSTRDVTRLLLDVCSFLVGRTHQYINKKYSILDREGIEMVEN